MTTANNVRYTPERSPAATLAHWRRWWFSHSYRIECAFRECATRGPIARIEYAGEPFELPIEEYNGSAYRCSDGMWYGPQHIKDIVTVKWACLGW